jgi:hypothetical protein
MTQAQDYASMPADRPYHSEDEEPDLCWVCHGYRVGRPGTRLCHCPPPMSGPEANERATEDEDSLSFNGKGTPVERKNRFLTPREIITAAGETPPWICEPWVARGGVTDVAGAAKLAGKTTLTMSMAGAALEGGYFMGRKADQSPVVYLSEQGNNIVKALCDGGISEDTEGLHIMPQRLTLDLRWPDVVKVAVEKCLETGARLLVIDTLSRFAGLESDRENNAGDVMRAMGPLVDAAQEHDLGVWSIRHATHGGRGRGSTAFLHDVDIVITVRLPDAALPANVRLVEAHGRYDGIPARTNIEYRDGRYFDLGADSRVQSNRAREAVLDALAGGKEIPSEALLDRTSKAAGTSTSTANTVIGKLVEEGEIERLGRGVKGSPYRYILSFNHGGAKAKGKQETKGETTAVEAERELASQEDAR